MKIKYLYFMALSTILLLSAFNFKKKQKTNNAVDGMAYAVTWQENGKWFAVGPTQKTTSSYKSEEEAFDKVIGHNARTKGNPKHVYTCGKFYVYSLGVNYQISDLDALEYVRNYKGYNCSAP